MLVLDIPRKCPSNFTYIQLPLYHRVHLGLAGGTVLHGCLMASSDSPHLPELIVSPFEFEKWTRMWRLNLTVIDRPGIFHDVCAICRDNAAQLLAAESSTTQQQNLYQLEAIIEAEDEQKIEWIRLCILAKFFTGMTFSEDGHPRIRLQKLHSLWHAKRDYEAQQRDPKGFFPQAAEIRIKWIGKGSSEEAVPKRRSSKQKAPLIDSSEHKSHQTLRLLLPTNVRNILKERVRDGSGVHKHHDDGFYLRLSDTKNRFLRVLFFRSDDPVIHARIEYHDLSGATAEVTDALKAVGFNILSAYLGPSEARHRVRLELLVRSESLTGKDSTARKLALEQALTYAQISELQLAISYPRDYAHSWDRKGIKLTAKNLLESVDQSRNGLKLFVS